MLRYSIATCRELYVIRVAYRGRAHRGSGQRAKLVGLKPRSKSLQIAYAAGVHLVCCLADAVLAQ